MKRRKDWQLGPYERMDARHALEILGGSMTLVEAARVAMKRTGGPSSTTTLEAACDGYLRRLLELKKRAATFGWYERRFAKIMARWPGATLDEITRAEVSAWLESAPVGRTTAAGWLRAMRALYNWSRSKEPPLCRTNPTENLVVEAPNGKRKDVVLAADAVEAILEAAGVYRHAIALMVFAGIRPEEVAGPDKPPLLWEHVDREEKRIRIPAEISKTEKARILEGLPEVVWAWLANGPKAGPVSPFLIRQATRRALEVLRRRNRKVKRWPHDAFRHTAASWLFATGQTADQVSRWLGHEGKTQLLHQRYLGVMTRAEAERIAALRPRVRR